MLQMAQEWYKTDLTGVEWNEIAHSTLSNEQLGKIGFQLGLDECASKLLYEIPVLPKGSSLASFSLNQTRLRPISLGCHHLNGHGLLMNLKSQRRS